MTILRELGFFHKDWTATLYETEQEKGGLQLDPPYIWMVVAGNINNPADIYAYGVTAKEAIDTAKSMIDSVEARPSEFFIKEAK
jgi:hypothetical protein